MSANLIRHAPQAGLCIATLSALGGSPNIVYAATVPVTQCGNEEAGITQPGSLRDIVLNHVKSGDSVDLTICKGSTITLVNGAIPVKQDSLTILAGILGSGSPPAVKLDGNKNDRVFTHNGTGNLAIKYLTIQNGYQYSSSSEGGFASGGCINSNGSVLLNHSVVSGCTVKATESAYGGGINAAGSVELGYSTISDNYVWSPSFASGGGIEAAAVSLNHSAVTGNSANGVDGHAYGGGINIFIESSNSVIQYSTISNNVAKSHVTAVAGGMLVDAGKIVVHNSTISGNESSSMITQFLPSAGGLVSSGNATTAIYNSTIAFNDGGTVGGLAVGPNGTLVLASTIIANNTTGNGATSSDLYQVPSSPVTTVGGFNLVMSSSFALPNGFTVSAADPKLRPLEDNGGPTLTHALLPGSPAIGSGNNKAGFDFDQRGVGHIRGTSRQTFDIGSFEFDAIFWNTFE